MAFQRSASSTMALIGATSPSMEYTLSNTISLARSRPAAFNRLSKCAMSLWRKIFFSAPERRTPSIMEAWFSSSDSTRHWGRSRAMVEIDASFDTKPEVNTRAASLPCRSASSRSSSTRGWLVPEMLRVPPAPAPSLAAVSCIAPTTRGCWPMPR